MDGKIGVIMKYNENMKYNEKTGKWYPENGGAGWILKEHCKCCGEKYFTRSDKPSDYCSKSCRMKGEGNVMYGKTHTEEVKQILRNTLHKTLEKVKLEYGVENISQLNSVKEKKGQTILSEQYISEYVKKYGYELIKKDYLNNKHTILTLKCPSGHKFYMKWESFKRGNRCQECYYESLRRKWGIEDIEKYYEYRKLVTSLTNITYRKYKKIINPNNYKRSHTDYQLDHKFSILQGFKNNISPEIISSYVNLEMLTAYENKSKQDKCSITKEQLMEMYNKIS